MSDEFDDAVDPVATSAAPGVPAAPAQDRAARLMARLYGSANLALRRRLVACLLRPLGSFSDISDKAEHSRALFNEIAKVRLWRATDRARSKALGVGPGYLDWCLPWSASSVRSPI